MKILIVEDETEIADGISSILESNGYDTKTVSDGITACDEIISGIYDLVILDVMLPQMNGFDIARKIRADGVVVPIIMLTALSQTSDKISGLDCGADDYLTKPFEAGELLARIRARLRRHDETILDKIEFSDIRLQQATQKIYGSEKSIKLAKKEYQLLEYMMINHGQILSRDMLISRVWGYDEETEYNQLDVYISFLRKKLKFVSQNVIIVTTKGIGYSLEEV